jgi:hypothetical protein
VSYLKFDIWNLLSLLSFRVFVLLSTKVNPSKNLG